MPDKDKAQRTVSRAHWVLLILLLAMTVPWYWSDTARSPTMLGLPIWGFTSLVFSFLFAVAMAWTIMTAWKDDPSE